MSDLVEVDGEIICTATLRDRYQSACQRLEIITEDLDKGADERADLEECLYKATEQRDEARRENIELAKQLLGQSGHLFQGAQREAVLEQELDEARLIARRCYWLLKPTALDEETGKPLHEVAEWLIK